MLFSRGEEGVKQRLGLLYKLIPAKLKDNYDTSMKALVLLLTLLTNMVISLAFLIGLEFEFDKTPMLKEGGRDIVFLCLGTYFASFVLMNRFSMLIVAGNVAQIGIYFAAVIAAWMTGGIFSPMLFMLLIPPVYAFVLTNFLSGIMWAVIVAVTFISIWAVDYYEIESAYMIILDDGDFSKLCIAIPLITCLQIIAAVSIYEVNSMRLKGMLAQERNEFEFKASHDPLTGLANRDEFNVRIQMAIDNAQRTSSSLALVYIDLDGFKPINDTIGHHAGDVVLEHVSSRLESIVRGTDTVARMGGDEFAVILQGVGEEQQVKPILQKVLNKLAEDIDVESDVVNVHGSLGVAFFPSDAGTSDQLCRHADMAMYLAKEQKNTWRFYREVMETA